MKLDADGARARHRARRSPSRSSMDTIAAAQAIVEIAISKMSLAVREVSVAKGYDPRDFALVASGGAGPLHVLRDRARAAHPDRDRAAVSLAFLGARHAAGRRAPRFHPHLLFRSRERRLRRARRGARRDGGGSARQPAPRQGRRTSQIQLDLRYVGQEFTLSVPVDAARSSKPATARRSARPSTSSTSSATRTIRRTSRSRWSTSGSAPSASARSSRSRALGRRRTASAGAHRAVYFDDASKPVTLPGLRARRAGAGARIAGPALDPGARHHHGAVRGRHAARSRLRRTDHHGRRRVMASPQQCPTTPAARSRHARGDPQRAARRRQRDGGRPAAHLLQHDDLRGARLLHRAARSQGRARSRRTSAACRISSPISASSSSTA